MPYYDRIQMYPFKNWKGIGNKMTKRLINREIRKSLENKEFINVGTCDFDGRANVAPKFLLKIENCKIKVNINKKMVNKRYSIINRK